MMIPGPLATEKWEPVIENEVYLAFLRAEWTKYQATTGLYDKAFIDTPDLKNVHECNVRRDILWKLRGGLLELLPPTTWYRVSWLQPHHLPELRVIGRCGWDAPYLDENELAAVAARRPQDLTTDTTKDWEPILWGHSNTGPFTILEANNRLMAYIRAAAPPPLRAICYVGLSDYQCKWHLLDLHFSLHWVS